MVAWSKRMNGSTILEQAPTPDEKLAAREYQTDLYHHFTCASSRPAQRGRELYRATKWTNP